MPSTANRPPPPPKKARVRPKNELTDGSEGRAVKAGLILTLIIWPLLVWLLGTGFSHLSRPHSGEPSPKPKPMYDIQFVDDLKPPPPEAPPKKFVETNAEAPEDIPDKTDHFGARNQQTAQEKLPDQFKGEMPRLEGKKGEKDPSQVVSGELKEQDPLPPPLPPSPEVPEQQSPAQAQREQNPLSGPDKFEGENPDGVGMNQGKPAENTSAVPKPIVGEKTGADQGSPVIQQPQIDPKRPQPRRQLVRNRARPAILQENLFGTDKVGVTAVNAKFNQYGQYLQQLVEAVDSEWRRILIANRAYPPPGSQVVIKFRLMSDGTIGEFVNVDGNAGNQAAQGCKSAIANRAPYGKWTDDMLAMLGESQELVFSFFYE